MKAERRGSQTHLHWPSVEDRKPIDSLQGSNWMWSCCLESSESPHGPSANNIIVTESESSQEKTLNVRSVHFASIFLVC